MMSLHGKPLLYRIYERVIAAKHSGTVVIATTESSADEPIVELCQKENIPFFRGHPTDLLDRHYQVAKLFNAEAVVKIPSDCPLIDPHVIDKVLLHYCNNKEYFDFVSNLHPCTYPDGNDVEVFSMTALEKAWREASKDYEREHTTPYFWENDHLFRIGNVYWESGLDYSMTHRWTIDYEEDYLFIKTVYDKLYSPTHPFSLNDILILVENDPAIKAINNKYNGVNWYRHHIDELKTINESQTRRLDNE